MNKCGDWSSCDGKPKRDSGCYTNGCFRDDLAKPSEWISMATPPGHGIRVLVNSTELGIYSATPPLTLSQHITHWQKLPSPPDKE